jgi:hypothetical protein
MFMSNALTLTPASHDFFDELVSLVVTLASFNAATESFWNSSSTRIPSSPTQVVQFYGTTVHAIFPTHSLMHEVVRNIWPRELKLTLSTSSVPLHQSNPVELQSSGIEKMITQLVGATFLKYYERHAHLPKFAHPGGPKTFPELWRFAWLLRNAIAHGDKWKISDPTFPTTSWNGISVSPADNEQPWFKIGKYIAGGDVILLMEQLNATPP